MKDLQTEILNINSNKMDKKTAIEITEKLLSKSNIKYTNSTKKPNTPNSEIENLKRNIDFYEYILSGLYNNHF